MTYKYTKKDGWVGYCDYCNKLFQPIVVDISVYIEKNKSGEFRKANLSRKGHKGYCKTCCDVDGSVGYCIIKNNKAGYLKSRKVGEVLVF